MSAEKEQKDIELIDEISQSDYKYGFSSNIETEKLAEGLNEDVVRAISAKKNEPEFMLDFRLKAYRGWLKMKHPKWSSLHFKKPDFQSISYYAEPKKKP